MGTKWQKNRPFTMVPAPDQSSESAKSADVLSAELSDEVIAAIAAADKHGCVLAGTLATRQTLADHGLAVWTADRMSLALTKRGREIQQQAASGK